MKEKSPRVTLNFYLPENQYELDMALNASKYHSVLNDIGNHLRSKLKYGQHSEETNAALQEAYHLLNSACSEEKIDWV